MGKHKKKKSKKHKKRYHSSSDSSNSSDEWVEKSVEKKQDVNTENSENIARDEWMSLPTSFTSVSNIDKRLERQTNRRQEIENAKYDPSKSSIELNPYWRDGGDGLPSSGFKKPSDDFEYKPISRMAGSSSSSNWRKKDAEPKITKADSRGDIIVTNIEKEGAAPLTDNDLNAIAAKLLKAEIMGNSALVVELQAKLDHAKQMRESPSHLKSQQTEEDVILTQTDSKGFSRPLKLQSDYGESSGNRKKKQKVETHSGGQRVRYFPDDDKYSLKQMFENEKYSSSADQNLDFIKMAGKVRKNDDLDDVFTDEIRNKASDEKMDQRNKEKAISEHRQIQQSLDNCSKCLQSENMEKHLMVSLGETFYLCLPPYEPIRDGHCLIVPTRHVSCATQLDENEWSELMQFRKALTRMCGSDGEDAIFYETAMHLNRYPHMALECVPVPKEHGDLAPIYFKKAIDESETEWSSNKKLVSLAGRDVRRAIPKGLPYFSVSFGMEEGFAHVIEDQRHFPNNFAQEIIGGILDLHHSKWRKPKKQKFDEQKKRLIQFSAKWNNFDCTIK